MIDDVETLIIKVCPNKTVGSIFSFLLSLLKVLLTDLLVMVFFASQELMDSSNIHVLNMKPIYTDSSIIFAILFGKVIIHTVLIGVIWALSGKLKLFNVYEGHAVGVIVIFFICAYEFMFNVLFNLGGILGLEPLDSS